MVVVHLVPIWVFHYFPSQDGPVHVFNASVIRDYYSPGSTVLRDYFTLNPRPDPNWFVHLVLTALLCLVPHLVAEKLLLSAYVILLPLGMRYAIRAINRRAGFLSIMAFPFVYTWFLQVGFYGFSFGLAAMFFVLGYWLRHGRDLSVRQVAILTALLIVLYSCHVFPLLITYGALVILASWTIGIDLAHDTRDAALGWRSILLRLRSVALPLFVAVLPSLLLVAVFFLPRRIVYTAGSSLKRRLADLVHLLSLASFDRRELWLTTGFACLVGLVFIYCFVSRLSGWRINRWDGFLIVIAACLLLYFTTRETSVATPAYGRDVPNLIVKRLNLFPFFMVIMWLAAQRHSALSKRIVQVACASAALVLLGIRGVKYAQFNGYIAEYLSVTKRLEPGSTLLHLDVSNRNPDPSTQALGLVQPLRHASHYVASENNLVAFDNYEAAVGYFPVLFRPGRNPYLYIGYIEGAPPSVNFVDYPSRTGGQVDYVLLLHGFLEAGKDDIRNSIDRQLAGGYDEIAVSRHHLVSLFRRKNRGAEGGRALEVDIRSRANGGPGLDRGLRK